MTATQIRNVTGITDDAMLNAACECERKDELAEKIANEIIKSHGYDRGLYNGNVFDFDKVKHIVEPYGFKYKGADDEHESHVFANRDTGDELEIFPETWFPMQGKFRFANFLLL